LLFSETVPGMAFNGDLEEREKGRGKQFPCDCNPGML